MATIETLTVKLQAATDGFKKKLQSASKSVGGFSRNVTEAAQRAAQGFGRGVKKILSLSAKLGAGLLAATTAAATFGVKLAADNEQAEISFGNLLQSSTKAKKVLEELADFGSNTPFSFTDDLRPAAKSLLSFGLEAEKLMPTIRQLSDIAAGSGADLKQISLAYSKVVAKQKLELDAVNQIAEAGVPIYKALADAQGVSVAELQKRISAGKLGVDDLNQAFTNLTGSSGPFFEATAKQSKSLSGVVSTMKDNIQLALGKIGKTIAESLDLKQIVNNITIFIQKAIKWFDEWSGVIKQFFNTFKSIFVAMAQVAGQVFKTLGGFVAQFLSWFGVDMQQSSTDWKATITNALVSVEFAFKNWGDVVGIAVTNVKLFLVSLGNDFINLFTKVLPTTIVSFGKALLLFFKELAKSGGKALKELFDFAKSGGRNKIELDFSGLTDSFNDAFDEIGDSFNRKTSPLEQRLIDEAASKEKQFADNLTAFRKQRKAELTKEEKIVDEVVEKAKPKVTQIAAEVTTKVKPADNPKALQKGSVAAVDAIMNARKTTSETKIQKDQLAIQKGIKKELMTLNKSNKQTELAVI